MQKIYLSKNGLKAELHFKRENQTRTKTQTPNEENENIKLQTLTFDALMASPPLDICGLLVAIVIFVLKVIVVTEGDFNEAMDCARVVGFMFSYNEATVYTAGLSIVALLSALIERKYFAQEGIEEEDVVVAPYSALFQSVVAIVGFVFLCILWANDNATLMFFPEFYTNPASNCSYDSLRFAPYDIANGVAKFESFVAMLGILLVPLVCCCYLCVCFPISAAITKWNNDE